MATGTYNGKGATGCANDYDPKWSVYIDGKQFGTYFCNTILSDAYSVGANPAFIIEYGWCPSQAANRWLIYWGGALYKCIASNGVAGSFLPLGLETLNTTSDYNIDVRMTNLQRWQTNSGWLSLNTVDGCTDPNYAVLVTSGTAIDFYLPPWQ